MEMGDGEIGSYSMVAGLTTRSSVIGHWDQFERSDIGVVNVEMQDADCKLDAVMGGDWGLC